MSRIFLSYRRQDQPHAVARIYDHLCDRFGVESVFKDLDSLPPGQDFRRVLERALERCEATLVVIGPSWLDLKLTDGTRRLDHPADFVRLEIERSLARDIPVIPVLLDGTTMPRPEQLPEVLREMCYRQAVELPPDPHFKRALGYLGDAIARMLTAPAPAVPGQAHAVQSPPPPPVSSPPTSKVVAPIPGHVHLQRSAEEPGESVVEDERLAGSRQAVESMINALIDATSPTVLRIGEHEVRVDGGPEDEGFSAIMTWDGGELRLKLTSIGCIGRSNPADAGHSLGLHVEAGWNGRQCLTRDLEGPVRDAIRAGQNLVEARVRNFYAGKDYGDLPRNLAQQSGLDNAKWTLVGTWSLEREAWVEGPERVLSNLLALAVIKTHFLSQQDVIEGKPLPFLKSTTHAESSATPPAGDPVEAPDVESALGGEPTKIGGFTFVGLRRFSCPNDVEGLKEFVVPVYRCDAFAEGMKIPRERWSRDLGREAIDTEFVMLPPDGKPTTTTIGSPLDEHDRDEDDGEFSEGERSVAIAPFLIARTAMTQRIYHALGGAYDPEYLPGPMNPAGNMTWDEAHAFCERHGLRLPSAVEWEYACRAGTRTPFYFGSTITTDQVNYHGKHPYRRGDPKGPLRGDHTPVASFPGNAFGLFDMHGNTWDMCEDPVPDTSHHVYRGGSWGNHACHCRSASRDSYESDDRDPSGGFRACRSVP